jgi:hypothetical protein
LEIFLTAIRYGAICAELSETIKTRRWAVLIYPQMLLVDSGENYFYRLDSLWNRDNIPTTFMCWSQAFEFAAAEAASDRQGFTC